MEEKELNNQEAVEPEIASPPKRDYEEELLAIITGELPPEELRERLMNATVV